MALNSSVAHVLAMCERMLAAEEDKDVVFKLSDGEEKAHKVVLKAASSVFTRMFEQNMREKAEGLVELPDVDRISMRIFLQLIYTGHVNPADWGQERKDSETIGVPRVLGNANVTCTTPEAGITRFASEAGSWASGVLLDASGEDFVVSFRRAVWSNIMIGVADSSTPLGKGFYNGHGFFVHVNNGIVYGNYYGALNPGGPAPSISVPNNSKLALAFTRSPPTVRFDIDGAHTTTVHLKGLDPHKTYCPAVNIYQEGGVVDIVASDFGVSGHDCPLDILTAVAGLSKKYMVESVLSNVTQVLKKRLTHAKDLKDIDAFEGVVATAIATDMSVLRMAAMECAKDFEELRVKYDSQQLKPEVAFELEAIWPPPAKRRLVFGRSLVELK